MNIVKKDFDADINTVYKVSNVSLLQDVKTNFVFIESFHFSI